MIKKKMKIILPLTLLIYTFVLIGICFLVNKGIEDKKERENDAKMNEIIKTHTKKEATMLDKVIAFGPQNSYNLYSNGQIHLSYIEKANILKSEDISRIKEDLNIVSYGDFLENVYDFMIYFGIKDEKDYVYLKRLNSKNEEYYLCESNLEYSFSSIIDEYYLKYGIIISDDELKEAKYDSAFNLESGIIVCFVEKENTYHLSYLFKKDGKAYVINK